MKYNSKCIFHDNRTQRYIPWQLKLWSKRIITWGKSVIQVHKNSLYLVEKLHKILVFFSYFCLYLSSYGNIMTSNVNIVIRIFSFLDVLPMGQRASSNQQYILCNNKWWIYTFLICNVLITVCVQWIWNMQKFNNF